MKPKGKHGGRRANTSWGKPNAWANHSKPHAVKTIYGKQTKPKPITESWWATERAKASRSAWMDIAQQRAKELTMTSSQLQPKNDFARQRTASKAAHLGISA